MKCIFPTICTVTCFVVFFFDTSSARPGSSAQPPPKIDNFENSTTPAPGNAYKYCSSLRIKTCRRIPVAKHWNGRVSPRDLKTL
eukprot:122163-Rhodomonas_salina.3